MIATMLSQIPARIISPIRILPVPKTMAFGGVPTGIMNAQEAPNVVQRSSVTGLIFSDSEIAATSGIIVAASAVLEVNSEAMTAMAVTPVVIPQSGRPESPMAAEPTTCAAPVL